MVFDPKDYRLITPYHVSERQYNRYVGTGALGDQKIAPAPGTLPPKVDTASKKDNVSKAKKDNASKEEL